MGVPLERERSLSLTETFLEPGTKVRMGQRNRQIRATS